MKEIFEYDTGNLGLVVLLVIYSIKELWKVVNTKKMKIECEPLNKLQKEFTDFKIITSVEIAELKTDVKNIDSNVTWMLQKLRNGVTFTGRAKE
jgi:hypothetical protein